MPSLLFSLAKDAPNKAEEPELTLVLLGPESELPVPAHIWRRRRSTSPPPAGSGRIRDGIPDDVDAMPSRSPRRQAGHPVSSSVRFGVELASRFPIQLGPSLGTAMDELDPIRPTRKAAKPVSMRIASEGSEITPFGVGDGAFCLPELDLGLRRGPAGDDSEPLCTSTARPSAEARLTAPLPAPRKTSAGAKSGAASTLERALAVPLQT
jgi:hypothetical protein